MCRNFYFLRFEDFEKIVCVGPTKDAAQHRVPLLRDARFSSLISAPDTFTPDGQWIIGETPEVRFISFSICYYSCADFSLWDSSL